MARRKRPSVTDYLADLDQPAVATSSRKRKAQTAPLPAATTGKRRKITLYFRQALLEEARSAVLALGAAGRDLANLSRLFGAALERGLVRLRKAHNEGQPFPPYKSRLPGGRPRGGS